MSPLIRARRHRSDFGTNCRNPCQTPECAPPDPLPIRSTPPTPVGPDCRKGAVPTSATPNSQMSDPSTEGSRSIPYADMHTLARLLSADRDGTGSASITSSSVSATNFNASPSQHHHIYHHHHHHPQANIKPLPPTTQPPLLHPAHLPMQSQSRRVLTDYDSAYAESYFRPISPPPTSANNNWTHQNSFPVSTPSQKTGDSSPPLLRVLPKRAISAFPATNIVDDQNFGEPRSAPSSRFATSRPVNPLTHSAPACKISWHRPSTSSVTGPDSDAIADHHLLRFDSAASDNIPIMFPVTHHAGQTQADHSAFTSTMCMDENHLTRGLPRGRTATHVGAGGLRCGIINQPQPLVRRPKRNRRLHASYLTAAFLRRKMSMMGDDDSNQVTSAAPGGGLPLIHSYATLAPFGLDDAVDPITLFTNSLRAEINDLIFLASLLQWWCTVGVYNKTSKSDTHNDTDDLTEPNEGTTMAAARKRHRNIEVDFELWFTRFSQYADLMLYGIEEVVMRYVLDALAQRDVMMSRAKADVEADDGMSRVQAWSHASTQIYEQMDSIRNGMSDIDNRLLWLRRTQKHQQYYNQPPTHHKHHHYQHVANTSVNNSLSCSSTTLSVVDTWTKIIEVIKSIVPQLLSLLNDVDARVAAVAQLKPDFRRALRRVHRQMAVLLTKEGASPLSWGAVATLTRWIGDKKVRNDHVKLLTKAARLPLLSRYRADSSHHTIVKLHQTTNTSDFQRNVPPSQVQ